MNCDEKISQCYEGIIACQAQAILERLEKICIRELQKCKRDSGKMTSEEKMLWFQTDEFNDWYTEVFQDEERLSQRFFKDGMPDGYSVETVTAWCLSQILSVAANYTNARINRYLSGGYELD